MNDLITKQYFTIGDIADQLRIETSAIRFWEGEFEHLRSRERRGLEPRKRNGYNVRKYTLEEIQRVIDMHQLVSGVDRIFKGCLIGCGLQVPSAVLNYPKRKEIMELFNRPRIIAFVKGDKLNLEMYG